MAKAKKLPSGNWRVRVYCGKNAEGKPTYKSFTAETKKEAEYQGALYALKKKEKSSPMRWTLAEAAERYIDDRRQTESPATIRTYLSIARTKYQELMPMQLEKITQEKLQEVTNKEALRLAPKTVISAHGFISSVIRTYVPDFVVSTKLPKKKKSAYGTPSPEVLKRIFDCAKGSSIELPILLAATMSLRMSEILALKWSDIENKVAHINEALVIGENGSVFKSTKTEAGDRYILVPECVMTVLNTTPKEGKYIFTKSRNYISKHFKKLLEDNGLPSCRFHDLRHANASAMLLLNIPDKYGMERGGWATRDTYHSIYQQTFTQERIQFDNKINQYFDELYDS